MLFLCTQITDGYHTVVVEKESLCQRSTCLQLLNMLSLVLNNECNTVNRESYTKIIRCHQKNLDFNSIQFNSLLQTKSPYTSTYIYK